MTTMMPLTPPGGGDLTKVDVQTLAEAYLWLQEVRTSHASFLVERANRVSKLDARARYILGSLQAARRFLSDSRASEAAEADHAHTEALRAEMDAAPGSTGGPDTEKAGARSEALVAPFSSEEDDPLSIMEKRTKEDLDGARGDLDRWCEEQSARFEEAFLAAEDAIIERTEAYAAHHRPLFRVEVTHISKDSCIAHVHRPSDEEAVVLCSILAGRPPSRYDYLRDDSVDVVDGRVHLAVREHGVYPEAISDGGPDAEDVLVRGSERRLLPIRAHLPVCIPSLEWPRMRLRTRGPVLELEVRNEGGQYSHLVKLDDCELFTGYLVSLRARELVEVDIQMP